MERQTRSQASVYRREANKNTGAFWVTVSAVNAPNQGTAAESQWDWSRDSLGQGPQEGPLWATDMSAEAGPGGGASHAASQKTVQVGEEQVTS